MQKTITQQIIEDLYTEALMLADEARSVFDMRDQESDRSQSSNEMRISLSIEGLRTTTRVMHVLAWLLNQRAYFSGELSAQQLERHGSLGEDRPSDPKNLAILPLTIRSLIRDSERLQKRVARIDAEQRARTPANDDPVGLLQDRIAQAFSAV